MILMIPRKESVIVDVPAVENSNDVGSSGNTSNQNNNNAPSSTEIPQSTKKLIQKKDTKEILRLEPKLRKSLIAAEVTDILLGYSFAILLTLIITVLGKNLVGKPRPDYFNRCFPCVDLNNYNEIISFLDKMDDLPNFECQNIGGDKQQDDTQQNLTLSNQASSLILRSISDCNDTKINCDTKCQLNGRRSFPSGHSATAWVIFSFTAFFLFGKLNTFLAKNRSQTIRLLPGFSMFAIALWISISRTQDYRHDYYDVLCGGLIGLICGWIGYKTNYPKLNCAKANYSRRQVRILDDH